MEAIDNNQFKTDYGNDIQDVDEKISLEDKKITESQNFNVEASYDIKEESTIPYIIHL